MSFSGRPNSWANPEKHWMAGGSTKATTPEPPPVHNDGPSMHDLVIKDILSRDLLWDLSVGAARHIRDQVADDLLARKQFGLDKYGTILQTGNGRSFLLDLYQELMDASVYARGRLLEVPEDGLEWVLLFEVYDDIVTHLVKVRRLLNASTESLSVRSASSMQVGRQQPWVMRMTGQGRASSVLLTMGSRSVTGAL